MMQSHQIVTQAHDLPRVLFIKINNIVLKYKLEVGMSTPEVHEMKHATIESCLHDLKDVSLDNTNRIITLEKSETVLNVQMKSTMESIEDLINWIKWGLGIGIASYVGFFTWLLQQKLG